MQGPQSIRMLRTENASLNTQSIPEKFLGLSILAVVAKGPSEHHRRFEGVQVLRAKDLSLSRERLQQQFLCFVGFTLFAQSPSKHLRGLQGISMLGAQRVLLFSKRLAKDPFGFRVASLDSTNPTKHPLRSQSVDIFRPESIAANFRSARVKWVRLGIEPQALVYRAHNMHHSRLGNRIPRQTCVNVLGGLVEKFAGCDAVAACLARVRDLEHPGHKSGDPL